ncbi:MULTISPECIES: hypothetical protein [unclassified Vibrio]|uniref:Uncharacterized protein n=1 Tax=Vibrio sp. HB236076 TaxID=3232307 RepID=A0AB39HA22_9VIBR|nr:hypothetical protein [Vibrio sp. HB161653]MDP5253349.1 hypothetical protein [Vibrio sp. HB161653]
MASELNIECLGSFVLRHWWGNPKGLEVGKRYVLFRPSSSSVNKHEPYFLDDNGVPRSVYNGDWCKREEVKTVSLKSAEKIIKHYENGEFNMNESMSEQPSPKLTLTSQAVIPEVMKDLTDRLAKGMDTYGVPLMSNNGRDALKDLYEELLDAACYVKQVMMEKQEV